MSTENVRRQILLKSQKLFQAKGLEKISMEDVAKAIEKGKSTLYYYFKSKDEIFSAVMDMEVDDIIMATVKEMSLVDSFEDKLIAFSKVKLQSIQKRRSFFVTMERQMNPEEILHMHQMKRSIHSSYLQKEKLVLLPLFMNAMAHQEADREFVENTIVIFLSSLRGIIRETLVHEQLPHAITLLQEYCKIFSRGLE